MKRIIALILTLLCVLALAGCGGKQSGSSLIMGDATGRTERISTPYADLRVSKTFFDNTENKVISESPYALRFSAKDGAELFTIYVDEPADFLMGTLKNDGGGNVFYAKMAKLDSGSKDYDQHCIFQEEINTIIENLEADYTFVRGKAEGGGAPQGTVSAEPDTFEIKTSLVTLKYPAVWKDKIDTEVTDGGVVFSTDGAPLFELVFSEGNGSLLGVYDGTPVYVIYHEAKTDEQKAMLEDVNVILQNLMKDKKFTVHINNAQ